MEKPAKLLLTEGQVTEIRSGIEQYRGPILLKWLRQLLDDRDVRVEWLNELLPGAHAERVRLERERNGRAVRP